MENSIAKMVRSCMRAFQLLSAAVLEASEQQAHSLGDMSSEWAKDKFDRFKLWSQNIGAHRSGRSSLDYRLRDASNLRKQSIDLVGDLAQALEDATSIISGARVPWNMEQPSKEDLSSDSMSSSSASEDDETSLAVDNELTQIMMDVIDIIDCLLRLSVSVQNPAPHDRFKAAIATNTSFYEATDIEHVRAKFISAEKWLVERLGKAISHRRQYFKYRDAHHQKLASGLEDPETELHIAQSTVASSIPQHLKTTNTRADVPSFGVLEEDQRSDTGYSQTSYATSTANSERLRVPKIPDAHLRGAFECPFCFMMISVSTSYAWKKHVFADLRPYVCLEQACEIPHEEYARRHHWFGHLEQAHWRVWSCPFTCGGEMTSADALRVHLVETHSQSLHANDIEKLVQMGARKVAQISEATCPLCREILPSAKKYLKHVGRHQEELALFALPKLDVPDEHGQGEDESIPGELDSEQDDFGAESQSSDEDEHAQESLEYTSQNEESSSFDLPTRSSAAPADFATHTMSETTTTELYGTELYGSGDDHENLRRRKPEIGAGHGEQKDKQQLELRKDAEEHPSDDDGSIGRSHHHQSRRRSRDESNMSYSRSPSRAGSDAFSKVELNETGPDLNRTSGQLEAEEEYRRRISDQLRESGIPVEQIKAILDKRRAKAPPMRPAPVEKETTEKTTYTRMARRHVSIELLRMRGIEWELDTNPDYIIIKRWVPPEEQKELWSLTRVIRDNREGSRTDGLYVHPFGSAVARPPVTIPTSPNVATPGRRFDGPVAVSKIGRKSYGERPYVEPLGPAAARPTVAIPTSPNVVTPGRRFDGPVMVSKTSQPAISYYQDPAYSSAPRSAGMERPTVFYKYDGVQSPSAVYEDGNYYPRPLDKAPEQSQRAHQPASSDEPADNDREKRHNAISHNQDPADSSGPHSTRIERPTGLYKYDGGKSPTAGYEDGNYFPHPLNQAPDQSQRAQQPTSSDHSADNERD